MPPFVLNIPNALTIFRLITVPLCTVPLLFGEPTIKTLIVVNVIFIVGAITDFLDGYLARKLNQMSEWGAYMDPLIDKYLIWALYLVFTLIPTMNVPMWTFAMILIRDLSVTQMRNYALKHQIKFKTSFLAKCKTATQMVVGALILVFLLVGALSNNETLSAQLMTISTILIEVVAVFTFITGLDYAYTLYKLKK